MTIDSHMSELLGFPIAEWRGQVLEPEKTVYRITLSYEETEKKISWDDKFRDFLANPNSSLIHTLVVGFWGYPNNLPITPVESLVIARDKLPNLKRIFLGDITFEETEISWIHQFNVTPLFLAYPELEYLGVRGANDSSLGQIHHQHLKALVIQTGGLNRNIIHEILASTLPNLEHLELWLGDEGYGANTTIEDIRPLLNAFPKLKYLGLCNSEYSDEIAEAVAQSGILKQLETLDLSLGTLGDEGMNHLLNNPDLLNLKKLDIHHHFCSKNMIAKLKVLPIEVDTSGKHQVTGDDDRYVAVSE